MRVLSTPAALLGALGLVPALVLSGCGTSVKADQAFTMNAATSSCLVHQQHSPTKPYEGGPSANTLTEIGFLRYFTKHGSQPFCDGKTASAKDRAWGQLYAQLTSNPDKVSTILAKSGS